MSTRTTSETVNPADSMTAASLDFIRYANLQYTTCHSELHLHVEGSLEPEMMFDLARKSGVALPCASVEALRAVYDFTDLQPFLGLYYASAAVQCTERDFYEFCRSGDRYRNLGNTQSHDSFHKRIS
jgi:hypothetical protein